MNIKYLLVFCLGAVTGSVFAARFLDERYSKIADEEIESVKDKEYSYGEIKVRIIWR